MKSPRVISLCCVLLLVVCAGLAASLDRWFMCWQGNRAADFSPVRWLIGDGRKLFAAHFFRKADVYFHSGMYPTIFDNNESFKTAHMAEDAGATGSKNTGDENTFLGSPRDIIDRFGRNFFPSRHTHLDQGGASGSEAGAKDLAESDGGQVREILPWLKLAQELDPEDPLTYTVTAYWLRRRMNKPREAEMVLREGLKNLPNHPALQFELGRMYFSYEGASIQCSSPENMNRARNIWLHALNSWKQQEPSKPNPDKFILEQILSHLAKLEEVAGHVPLAIAYWEQVETLSPGEEGVPQRIKELREKTAATHSP
ncbi:MAG: hypothetical protein U1F98_14800 [Verrucomicrobiota bacterium]